MAFSDCTSYRWNGIFFATISCIRFFSRTTSSTVSSPSSALRRWQKKPFEMGCSI